MRQSMSAREPFHAGVCECGREAGKCVKGDLDRCPAWDDDPEMVSCPRCQGGGFVDCHCGGDLCICDNYGEKPCPVCYGEGEVTEEREQRYLKARAEAWSALNEADCCARYAGSVRHGY